MADDNKRDNERVPVPSPLHGEVKVSGSKNASAPGATAIFASSSSRTCVWTPNRPTNAVRLILRCWSSWLRRAKGRIAHCHIGELKEGIVLYRTGVEFIENSDHAQAALEHFVEALKVATRTPVVVDGQIAEDGA